MFEIGDRATVERAVDAYRRSAAGRGEAVATSDEEFLIEGKVVGRHSSNGLHILFVFQGRGWVSGKEGDVVTIRSGQAAFWAAGETFSHGGNVGLEAIELEANELEFHKFVRVP